MKEGSQGGFRVGGCGTAWGRVEKGCAWVEGADVKVLKSSVIDSDTRMMRCPCDLQSVFGPGVIRSR